MSDYRLLAIDLDKTLLDNDHNVSRRNYDAPSIKFSSMRSLSGFMAHFVLEAMVTSILTFPCQYGRNTSLLLHPVVRIRKEERRHSLSGQKLYAWYGLPGLFQFGGLIELARKR
jgi:hypothetical protein